MKSKRKGEKGEKRKLLFIEHFLYVRRFIDINSHKVLEVIIHILTMLVKELSLERLTTPPKLIKQYVSLYT